MSELRGQQFQNQFMLREDFLLTQSLSHFCFLCLTAQLPRGQTIWLKINPKTSSQLSHGVVSQHCNTEGDRRGNPQPGENLLCWATSWSDVKTSQQQSSARAFKPSSYFLPFFCYSDCYTVLNFCYRHKQNQQGFNTYQSISILKKEPKHAQKEIGQFKSSIIIWVYSI